jgi:hypothetical protein
MNCIVTYEGTRDKINGFWVGFISISVTSSRNHTYYSAIADLHILQSTVAYALDSQFPLIASYQWISTQTSVSNHDEVFLLFRFQSLCTPLS